MADVLAITDWFVVTSAANTRQVRAIVDEIEEKLTETGGPKPIRIEGKVSLNWVLMDFELFVVHVMTDESRQHYDLERLWKDVPQFNDVA